MAYVFICEPCLDEDHTQCVKTENTPIQTVDTDIIYGGGHCVCICQGNTNMQWYLDLKSKGLERRKSIKGGV